MARARSRPALEAGAPPRSAAAPPVAPGLPAPGARTAVGPDRAARVPSGVGAGRAARASAAASGRSVTRRDVVEAVYRTRAWGAPDHVGVPGPRVPAAPPGPATTLPPAGTGPARPASARAPGRPAPARAVRPAGRRAPDTVHLSFSGGEARGYAHIGCLQAVERLGLRVTEVSGSSIGALVAALYAAGLLGRRHPARGDEPPAAAVPPLLAELRAAYPLFLRFGGIDYDDDDDADREARRRSSARRRRSSTAMAATSSS